MTAWCRQPTIFGVRRTFLSRRRVIEAFGLMTLIVALTTTLLFAVVSHAAPDNNQTIGFQGRLFDADGEMVADGSYNVQFRIYEGGTGTTAGNPNGVLKWTETYVNDGSADGAVEVKNGLLSVNLGSIKPFGDSVDWSNGSLWLSMNIAGTAANCTTFGTNPCEADGEMLPMKRMTASPFAMNAGAVGGKTANNLVQLAQGVQTDNSNRSSIAINKTGSGNLIQLQSAATDVFTITNSGDLKFGNSKSSSIAISSSKADTSGQELLIAAGSGGSGVGTTGGTLVLQGGAGGGTDGTGGDISIDAGAGTGTGAGGAISIGSVNASSITIGGSQNETARIQAKNSVTIATNGVTQATFSDVDDTVYFGNGVSASAPNNYTLQGTNSTTNQVDGGSLAIQGGNATAGDANGGNLTLSGGVGSGDGVAGLVIMSTPTFATVTDDANCYTNGAVVEASCTVTELTVNNAAAVIVGFSAADQTATLPDPALTTAGRIMYVTAADGSQPFTLAINGGGENNQVIMKENSTTSLLWNGVDWTVSSGNTVENTPLTEDPLANPVIGSLYYDTTLGALQCYEATGWGACSSQPDIFVTLSPEYSNAVSNGSGIGDLSSDFCSDALDINDGSSGQPTVCATNDTYNFYDWTSDQPTAQTKHLFVTYQLPESFDSFAPNKLSLLGLTDNADAAVSYQVYRNSANGLIDCGSEVVVSTGAQTAWQKAAAVGGADPANCGFSAGESIVIKINLTSANNGHAYISNLGFVLRTN